MRLVHRILKMRPVHRILKMRPVHRILKMRPIHRILKMRPIHRIYSPKNKIYMSIKLVKTLKYDNNNVLMKNYKPDIFNEEFKKKRIDKLNKLQDEYGIDEVHKALFGTTASRDRENIKSIKSVADSYIKEYDPNVDIKNKIIYENWKKRTNAPYKNVTSVSEFENLMKEAKLHNISAEELIVYRAKLEDKNQLERETVFRQLKQKIEEHNKEMKETYDNAHKEEHVQRFNEHNANYVITYNANTAPDLKNQYNDVAKKEETKIINSKSNQIMSILSNRSSNKPKIIIPSSNNNQHSDSQNQSQNQSHNHNHNQSQNTKQTSNSNKQSEYNPPKIQSNCSVSNTKNTVPSSSICSNNKTKKTPKIEIEMLQKIKTTKPIIKLPTRRFAE